MLICLLAVFPCGAALTVLGTLGMDVARAHAIPGHMSHRFLVDWMPMVWAGGGALGFVSLIHGVDRLLVADRMLRWHVLLGIVLGIAMAGFFAATYPLQSSSAVFLRIVCLAPVAIELLLVIRHVWHFLRKPELPAGIATTESSLRPREGADCSGGKDLSGY